ncbi:MAG: hypothetical protein O2960_30725 [Verrucomicrobia bacterium]|nr:hypothetical protein [Verrucomicrobiota bacterium]
MSTSEILSSLAAELDRYANQTGIAFWENIVPEDIHKAVSILRKKISDAGGNPHLIESNYAYAGGYRLSTPPCNIRIENFDDE